MLQSQLITARAMHIQSIPMCKRQFLQLFKAKLPFKFLERSSDTGTVTGVGSSNNYAYLVVDDKSKDAVIIDPANPPECVSRCVMLSHTGSTDEGAV